MAGKHGVPEPLFNNENTNYGRSSMLNFRTKNDLQRIQCTVYISAPMTGYQDFNRERIKAVEHALTQAKVTWFSPRYLSMGGMGWAQCVRVCKAMIEETDAILLLPSWDKSRGCLSEVSHARNHFKQLSQLEMSNDEFDAEFRHSTGD